LEVRVPFLDVDMVSFCMNLPPEVKLNRGRFRKHILRQSLVGRLPQRILDRPKSGFNVPVEKWMRRDDMRQLLFEMVRKHGDTLGAYLGCKQVEQLWEEHSRRRCDHGHVLFTILMFALWCERVSAV